MLQTSRQQSVQKNVCLIRNGFQKLVQQVGETSNSALAELFDVLERWNTYLDAEKFQPDDRLMPNTGPLKQGPSL